jgi:hypothetical protein
MKNDFVRLKTIYNENDLEMHRLYKKLMTGKQSNLEDIGEITNIVMILVDIIKGYFDTEDSNDVAIHTVINERIRASAIDCKKMIMIFTDNLFLGSFVKNSFGNSTNKTVLCVSLSQGIIFKIVKAPFQTPRYRYMNEALYSLTAHKQLIQRRGKFSIANVDLTRPWIFTDTEFKPVSYQKSKTIWDIALINAFDLYASMITLVDPGAENFDERFTNGLTYEDIKGSPKIEDLQALYFYKINGTRPIIHYYHAIHDISFFYEAHEHYDEARENNSINKEDWVMNKNLDYGVDFVNCFEGGKLSEVYQAITNCDATSLPHILLHRACPDTLLLLEIIMTKKLGI